MSKAKKTARIAGPCGGSDSDYLGDLLAYASRMAHEQLATSARRPSQFPQIAPPPSDPLREYLGKQAGLVVLRFRPLRKPTDHFHYSDLSFLEGVGSPIAPSVEVLANYKEEPPWDSRPRPEISDWARRLFEHLRKYGLKLEDLIEALGKHEFHEQGKDTDVKVDPSDASAATFFPGWTWYFWQLVYVFDGNTHTVLFPETVANILQNGFQENTGLTGHAKIVIHEMIHVMLANTKCGKDDDDDEAAMLLEDAIAQTVSYNKAKAMYGPQNGIVRSARTRVKDIIDRAKALGLEKCLERLGIAPLP